MDGDEALMPITKRFTILTKEKKNKKKVEKKFTLSKVYSQAHLSFIASQNSQQQQLILQP
jgi:hypothetical protein